MEKTIHSHTFLHPCGQCMVCRIQKRDEWAIRIILESQQHEQTLFVTLTYDSDNYPEDQSLSKRELQLFVKRLRKNTNEKFRYFACGEYGGKTGRAHYHLVLFGLRDYRWIEKSWNKGFVDVKLFEAGKHAAYVAKYTTKAIGQQKQLPDGRQKEFALMSRKPGIGHAALQSLQDNIKHGYGRLRCSPLADEAENQQTPIMSGLLRYNGRQYPMPKYYKNKLVELEGAYEKTYYYRSLEELTESCTEGGSEFGEILRRADARVKSYHRGLKYFRKMKDEEKL